MEVEFPTATVCGHTLTVAARRGHAGERARATLSEGAGGNASASRAWKGNDRRIILRAYVFPFHSTKKAFGK